jgi:hypothetical protein
MLAICVGVVFADTAGASGKFCAWHGDDVGCVEVGHYQVTSCDREADGHYVRAWYIDNKYFDAHAGAWDLNGSQAGCDWVTLSQYFAVGVRACEEVVGCSNWVYDQ